MSYQGTQTRIWANSTKTFLLFLYFPLAIFGLVYAIMYFTGGTDALASTLATFSWLGPIILIWGVISFFFQRQIVFGFSGAKAVTRTDEPQLYNIIENLCISQGLQPPKVGIIEDNSINAFALGWNTKNGWIVFSRGILNRLDRREIEAVAAHELTHIINKDSLLMIVIIVYIGIISTLGEILCRSQLYRSHDRENKTGAALMLIGFGMILLGAVIYPLVRLAISRKREFMADAGSVMITHDADAMISALQKISKDPYIESITKDGVAQLCIANPFNPHKKHFLSNIGAAFSTHPPIEARIAALKNQ